MSTSASEVTARYAPYTRDEVERTLPIEQDEEFIIALHATTHYSGSSIFVRTRRGYVRMSTKRLCVLRHYGFIRDRIIVIPPGAITSVEGQWPHSNVRVSFRSHLGDAVITLLNGERPKRNPTASASPGLAAPFRQIVNAIGPDAD